MYACIYGYKWLLTPLIYSSGPKGIYINDLIFQDSQLPISKIVDHIF